MVIFFKRWHKNENLIMLSSNCKKQQKLKKAKVERPDNVLIDRLHFKHCKQWMYICLTVIQVQFQRNAVLPFATGNTCD